MSSALYFVGFWDYPHEPDPNKDVWIVKEFQTRKDCLRFIRKFIMPNETVNIYSNPKCTRLYAKVKESNGQLIYLSDNVKGRNRLQIVQKDGTVRMV